MNSILSISETAVVDYLLLASMTAAILVVVAWGLVKLVRVKKSANRHMIWLFTLLAIVLLPGIRLHGPKLTLTVLPANSSPVETAPQPIDADYTIRPMVENVAGTSEASTIENALPEADALPSFRLPPIITLLAWGWGIGFLLMLVRLTFGGIKLRHLLQSAVPVADAMGPDNSGRRGIDLMISSKVDCPVCFGLLQPVIVMPTKMYDETSPEDLRMILRHELAHIERRDCWVNLFQRLVEAALFFHPLVWYASFQLTQQREELCDQHVIAGGASPEDYVELLGRIARQGFEKRTLQAVALFEGRLLSRVKSLMSHSGSVQTRVSRKAMGGLAAAAMLCLAVGSVRLEAKSETVNTLDTFTDKQETASFRPQVETLGPDVNRPVGDCSLSGRVVSTVTGDPIENATAYLYYSGTGDPIFVEVASDGSFFFDDIPSGQYSLSITHVPGFQDAFYCPENRSANGITFFSLVEGEDRSGIVFELEPAFSISGKVLGEVGRPITNEGLSVLAWKEREYSTSSIWQFMVDGQTVIEPDGTYFIDGLSGDPVFVMVMDLNLIEEEDDSWPPCYYPGTVSRDQAKRIDFTSGNSRENIDIQLVRKGGGILEGIVSDEATADPIANAVVTVHHTDIKLDLISTRTDDRGHYRVENIGTGELLAHIDARTSGYLKTGQPVSIEAGKTVRLDVALKSAAVVSGIFIDENGRPVDISMNARGYAYTNDPTATGETGGGVVGVTIGAVSSAGDHQERPSTYSFSSGQGDYSSEDMVFPTDSSFLIKAVKPGETHLMFDPKEQGMEVKRILYEGKDIMTVKKLPEDAPPEALGLATVEAVLETHAGETIEDISIVLGPVGAPSSSL